MVFSSLVFLFLFFSIHIFIYHLVQKKYRNTVLLISSLIFYSWGGPRYLILLMGETLASWLFALLIQKSQTPLIRKIALIGELIVLLSLLAWFKYAGFIFENIQALTGIPELIPAVALPIGISFYTFQLISYVIDVYRRKIKAQNSYWKLLLYSSLFHQCIAGPIIRYETIQEEIDNRSPTKYDLYYGVRRFSIGLAKKAVLANSCAALADTLVPVGTGSAYGLPMAAYWLGMAAYMLQIYLDFSAYSDMAIGMGRMIGFHYLENFNYPYMAKSVQDFWRRWHISLSSFFRDYVYIPLGGSRVEPALIVRNLAITWFLTGLWHGASWNYVLWGMYFFVFLVLERFLIQGRLPRVLNRLYTILVVFIGWIIFRFTSLSEMSAVLLGIVGVTSGGFTSLAVHTALLQNIFLLIFCCIACTDLGKTIHAKLAAKAQQEKAWLYIYSVTDAITPPLLLALGVLALVGASYNPFIYFQF